MTNFYPLLIALISPFLDGVLCQLSEDKDELLSWCLKSKNHKISPGKEDSLHQQCSPWKDYACCTNNVTKEVHEQNMYNFTFDHCWTQTKRVMSQQCRKHFNNDFCFYECEPHIGLWVAKTNRKIASERFYEVPLCAKDCDKWFEDCKEDFTCAHNWPKDFKFKSGVNTCKENAKCLPFKEIYSSAKDFCENVWDHSWKYTPDDKPCIKVWFDGESGNPNKKVAEYYIDEHIKSIKGQASNAAISNVLFTLGLFIYFGLNLISL